MPPCTVACVLRDRGVSCPVATASEMKGHLGKVVTGKLDSHQAQRRPYPRAIKPQH